MLSKLLRPPLFTVGLSPFESSLVLSYAGNATSFIYIDSQLSKLMTIEEVLLNPGYFESLADKTRGSNLLSGTDS